MDKKREQTKTQAQLMAINARAEMEKAGITVEDMAYIWSCSLSSAYRRLRMPETMTVGDLEALAKACGVSCSSLFGSEVVYEIRA